MKAVVSNKSKAVDLYSLSLTFAISFHWTLEMLKPHSA